MVSKQRGPSAELAGRLGLPFGANYHVAPSSTLDAVEAYRTAFSPSDVLSEPYVVVSADVVAAEDDATARELAFAVRALDAQHSQRARCHPVPRSAIAAHFPTPTKQWWKVLSQ